MGWALAFPVAFVLLGLGNTVGYHRLFTHRAFRASGPVRAILAVLGALHAGPPLLWIGLHRVHHLRSDDVEDPHSPRQHGLWWAHTGWLIGPLATTRAGAILPVLLALSGFGQQALTLAHDVRRLLGKNPPTWLALTPDLASDPALSLLERPLVCPGLFAGQVTLAWTVGGPLGILWLWLLHITLTNASWAVNSIGHGAQFGSAPHDTGDGSRDVPWLAPFTLGEAFHNSHHRYPRSARHAVGGGFDPSWWVIRGMVALGLARDPWLPRGK